MQLWLGQVPWNVVSTAREMIERSMKVKRLQESKRLIKSTIVILMLTSLGVLVAMLVIVRAIPCAYMPLVVSVPIYDASWMFLACFIVRQIWLDFTGRCLLLTFK